MIRVCTLVDLDWMLDMAYAFNDKHYDIPLVYTKTRGWIAELIEHGVCLRSDTGAIVGSLVDDPCRDWRLLVELAWYSEGRDGIRLLQAFENYGLEAGADEVRMTTLGSNSGVDKLLRKRGYTETERSHRLIL